MSAGIPDHIWQKFPRLKPLSKPPSLSTVNGFGLGVYGRRDYDQETETYVITRCLSALYLPLFALDAFRVADAGSRTWFFLGREPLSFFARAWNLGFGCLLAGLGLFIGVQVHTSSPAYRAEQEMRRAAASLQRGEALEAAGIYQAQLNGPAGPAAREGLQSALEACLKSDQAPVIAGAFRIVSALPPAANRPAPVLSNAFPRGLAFAEQFRTANADGALDILEATAKLEPTNSAVRPLKIALLKGAIAARPDNINRVVELALIYEAEGQPADCVNLLLPVRDQLGSTEGARILGQHLLGQGKSDEAYGLLFPYVQTRLERLRSIEHTYTNALSTAYRRALDELNDGSADRAWYDQYKKASKADQTEMINAYVESRMQKDEGFQRAQSMLKEANQIVPVTLDLGIVQLNRAHNLQDPDRRKAELEAAEKTFLAIRGFAGETDEYRMFLGQVYYWLGKSAEGKALFDELLAAKQRSVPILLNLANTLREVGETVAARQLCEEAYAKGKTDDERFEAASLRSRLQTDIDDEIAWLEKSDPAGTAVQIELNNARGQKALGVGNRDLAAQHFRKAVAGYENLPKNASVLNNHGLACLNLYRVTGDIGDYNRGLALLQEAVSLDPGNSLLLINTAHLLLTRAHMDAVGDAIRYDLIKESPDRAMLRFLYANEAERLQVTERLEHSDYFKKALVYVEKTLLLSPKSLYPYQLSIAMQQSVRRLPDLQKLQERLRLASPDLSEVRRDTREIYSGAKDQENQAKIASEIQRFERLLDSADVKSHPLSLEFVRTELGSLRLQSSVFGVAVDAARLLADARAAYDQHQDSATLDALINAHFFKAHEELRSQNPDYAQAAEQSRRALSGKLLIAALLERGHALSPAIRQNAQLLQAMELLKEHRRRFPNFRSASEWALLQPIAPTEAASLGRQLQSDQAGRLSGQIEYQLNPLSASAVLEQYWTHKLNGDPKRALEIYETARQDGVPLPPL